MILPWVSRLAYDVAVARAEAAEARADDLLAKYHDLMQRRANTDALRPAVERPAPEPDLVMMAVGQQSAQDPALGRYLASYVNMQRAQRAAGRDDALGEGELLERIVHWEHAESEGVGAVDIFGATHTGDSGPMH